MNLPSRPKFSWDVCNVPLTNGLGDQSGYARSVKLWKTFHSQLPATNSNKIAPNLHGIMLSLVSLKRGEKEEFANFELGAKHRSLS